MNNQSSDKTEVNNSIIDKYSKYHTTITSEHKWFNVNLRELWRYRDLIFLFVKRSFMLSYKQTILGPVWIFLTPFVTTVIYTIIFGNIANLSTDGVPKLLFYMTGNTLWSFFSGCINKTANTFRDNASIFGKVYYPRLANPISAVMLSGVNFFIQMIMFSVFWIYYIVNGAVSPNWLSILCLPLILIVLGSMALGCGIIVSSLTTKYRDLAILVSFGVSLWMYITPVVYPLSIAGEGVVSNILLLNPVTQIMEIFRYMMLGEGIISIGGIAWSLAFTAIVLSVGILIFNKVEKTFMDTV